MLAHGFRFFAKGQFSAKGHTHLRKTKELSGTTRAPSAERVEKLLVDSSRSLASSVWAQRLCKLKINLWGRVWGVYVFQKKLLRDPKTVEWKWVSLNPGCVWRAPIRAQTFNSQLQLQHLPPTSQKDYYFLHFKVTWRACPPKAPQLDW